MSMFLTGLSLDIYGIFFGCGDGICLPRLLLCRRLSPATLGTADSQRETSLRQKRLLTVLCLALPFPSPKVIEGLEIPTLRAEEKKKRNTLQCFEFFTREMGFFIAPSAFVSSPIACDTRLCRLATRDIALAKTVINRFMPCSPIPFSEGHGGAENPVSATKKRNNSITRRGN